MRPQSRFAVGRAAALQRGGVEGNDRGDIGRAQADMHATVVGDALQGIATVDPELRIFFAEPDRDTRPFAQFRQAQRS